MLRRARGHESQAAARLHTLACSVRQCAALRGGQLCSSIWHAAVRRCGALCAFFGGTPHMRLGAGGAAAVREAGLLLAQALQRCVNVQDARAASAAFLSWGKMCLAWDHAAAGVHCTSGLRASCVAAAAAAALESLLLALQPASRTRRLARRMC